MDYVRIEINCCFLLEILKCENNKSVLCVFHIRLLNNQTKQALKPISNSSRFKFLPMKTILLVLVSSFCHNRSGDPSNISWTPCPDHQKPTDVRQNSTSKSIQQSKSPETRISPPCLGRRGYLSFCRYPHYVGTTELQATC